MKTVFDIGSETEAGGEQTLLLEVGKRSCATAFLHKASNAISRITLTAFDEWEMEQQFSEHVQSLQSRRFESVVVCSAFPEALLVPNRFFNNNYSALDLVYEPPVSDYFHDSIPEWQLVNAYSIPKGVNTTLGTLSGSVQYLHAYTPTIKIYNGYVADNQLSVHFSEQSFRVLLKKDMAIQLAQTFDYKTPLDVVYFLLKICSEFELSQQSVFLILSGLIDQRSNLMMEMQQYFANIHFAQQPEISLPQSDHPHYFFTSLYNLAACVL